MRNTSLISIIIIFSFFACIKGGNSQEVISSQGSVYSNSNGSISFTVGEPVITTLTGSNNDVTQGFQQPLEKGPTTNLKIDFCNYTTTNFIEVIWAEYVQTSATTNATVYEFKFTNDTDPTDIYTFINYSKPKVTLDLAGISDYNTTYNVVVRAWITGGWTAWGETCQITSPAQLTTNLTTQFCNTNISYFIDVIWADYVPYSSTNDCKIYQFKFTNDTDPTDIYTFTNYKKPKVTLDLAGISDYNTTYNVVVKAWTPNGWTEWGNSCQVTSPAQLTTNLTTQYCNYTANSFIEVLWADYVPTSPTSNSNIYQFEFTNDSDPTDIYTFTNNKKPKVTLDLAGISDNGVTYNVRVRSWIPGGWTEWGNSCEVTSPGLLTTNLQSQYCNYTATTFSEVLWAEYVQTSPTTNSSVYEFRFINSTNSSDIYSYINYSKPKVTLALANITALSTTYNVDVRAWASGWTDWGSTCQITSPSTNMPTNNFLKNHNSINDNNLTSSINIYPNPNDGSYFYINAYGFTDSEDEIIISVLNLHGKQVYIENTGISANQIIKEITLNEKLADGIYLIKVAKGPYSSLQKLIIH